MTKRQQIPALGKVKQGDPAAVAQQLAAIPPLMLPWQSSGPVLGGPCSSCDSHYSVNN